MKKELIFSLFFILITINIVSAVTIDFNKETYQPLETALITIQGNFITPLSAEQIFFYEGRIQIPLVYDLGKIQDKYYIYALLPAKEKNLTLVIKDAHYMENTKDYEQDLRKNFSVQGEIIPFTINQGFIITQTDFNIKATSNTKAITVTSTFLDDRQEIYIPEGQTKKIEFSISDIENFTITDLTISGDSVSYKIPTAIITPTTKIEENKTIIISNKLRFSPSSEEVPMIINQEQDFTIILMNIGDEEIENISIEVPDNFYNMITISPDKLDLDADDQEEILIKIKPERAGYFSGLIEAKSDNVSAFFDLTLKIEEPVNDTDIIIEEKSCTEFQGYICASDEVCEGEVKDSREQGVCCVGLCKAKPEPTSYSKYIWLLIIILALLLIAYFLVKKYKKPGKSSSELLKERQNSLEKRFKGEEVRGKLSRD